jgi:hypothetical protein
MLKYRNQIVMSALVTCLLSACSSAPVVNGAKIEKDQVLATMNNTSKPDWAIKGEAEPFRVVSGVVQSVGVSEMSGTDRPSAGLRLSRNNAVANIARTVQNQITSVLTNGEEGTGYDSSAAKYIGSEMSSISASNIRDAGQWWEKVAMSNEDGTKKIIYRLYSLATMDEPALKAKIHEVATRGVSSGKVSEKFKEQLDKHMDHLLDQANSNTSAQAQ